MKRLTLISILIFSFVLAFGQSLGVDTTYVYEFKKKIDILLQSTNVNLHVVHSDGDWGSNTAYFVDDSLVCDVVDEFFLKGVLETNNYYNLGNDDCFSMIRYSENGKEVFEYHLMHVKGRIYERLVKGKCEKFLSKINRCKERLLNAP